MKLAVVTGGSRGLGAALCRVYMERGWRTVEFSRSGATESSVAVDLVDPLAAADVFGEALSRLAEDACEEIVAIANAGVLEPMGPVDRLLAADIAANLNVNVTAQILFAREVVAAFAEHACPKTLVTISSGAALHGYAGWTLYCAAKAALDSFVRALALEQAGRAHPVVALSVNPGVMDTAMQESIRAASSDDFPARERFAGLHEAGELRSPADVAEALAEVIEMRPAAGSLVHVDLPARRGSREL